MLPRPHDYLGPEIREGAERGESRGEEGRCRCMAAAGKKQQLPWLENLRALGQF
jgi:hypothetical protein